MQSYELDRLLVVITKPRNSSMRVTMLIANLVGRDL
jgi:hypothetical protein